MCYILKFDRNSHRNITYIFFPFSYNVLGISSGIGDFGGMQWKLLGTLTLGCIINFVCLIKGIKTSGKVNNLCTTYSQSYLFTYTCTYCIYQLYDDNWPHHE